CDFNNNSSPFCDFRQDVQDHSDWIRHRGATPTEGTGPSGDFPDGNGYYIYHEADNVVSGQGARLLSPVLRPRDSQLCVQFWFYMYGLESDNRLALLVQKPGAVEQLLWERQGIQSHSWLGEAVTVPASPGQDLTVVFEAVRGFSASCDTALDNITISSGACPEFLQLQQPSPPQAPPPRPQPSPPQAPPRPQTSPPQAPPYPQPSPPQAPPHPQPSPPQAPPPSPPQAPPHPQPSPPQAPPPHPQPSPSQAPPCPQPSPPQAPPRPQPSPPQAPPPSPPQAPPYPQPSPPQAPPHPQPSPPQAPPPSPPQAPPHPQPSPPQAPPPHPQPSPSQAPPCPQPSPPQAPPPCPQPSPPQAPQPRPQPSQTQAPPPRPQLSPSQAPPPRPQPNPPQAPPHPQPSPPQAPPPRPQSCTAPCASLFFVICVGHTPVILTRASSVDCAGTTTATPWMTSARQPGSWSARPTTLETAGTQTPSKTPDEHTHTNRNIHKYTHLPDSSIVVLLGLWVIEKSCQLVYQTIISIVGMSPQSLLCPSNSHYEPCVPPCPLSCVMSSHGQCQGPCAEGCVCDSGFIQSAGICVRQESCGCQYNGKYYQSGEEFFTPGCQSKCRCELGFPVCIPWNCSDQEYCGVQDGVLSCHPKGSAHCYVSGDPHYMTFDGRIYSFMGTCTYTLARTCRNNNGPWFSVEGKNEERGMPGVSYLRKIYVTVNGVTVTLMKSRRTLVNGLRVALPHSPSPWMSLFLSGQYVTVSTPFGLTVRWDGNHYAHITVPSSYYDQMCGLCGNYDNDAGNDFMLPDGSQAINSDDFGNSWQTDKDEDKTCRPGNDTDHPCDEHLGAEVAKPEKCGKLTNKQGPFRDCIAVVDPNPYFWSCVYDMCRYEGLLQTLCDQLQAYTDACLAAGATVHQWRAPDFCPLLCPPNSHYTLCGSQCPETCVPGHLPVGGCSSRCVEGCQCDPGFVLSDESCVPLRDCGCVDPQGSYHPVDESWYLPGCTQRCVCQGEGVIHCDNSSCSQMEICQLQNGQYGCQGLGNRATCSATGDPHYTTYDGKVHHFQGSCSYTLSQPCNASSHLPYFSVVTENEHRGNNKHVSYVKAVRVRVHQHTIVMSKGRRVQVDGVQMTPPVFLDQGVTVRLSGVFVTVETDFGLRVRFDGNHHADVSVLSTYSEQLCGLCGNYNGRPGDDNLRPDGRPADSSSELGESWQVPDNRTECSHDGGVDVCDKNIEAEAKKPTSCGMIIDPQGVFQPCHSVVPPEVFLESCVYDQCGTGGDTVALCLALQSYAALCAQAGVPIDWRNKTFCPLTCPVGSHYSPCGNACPASCTEPGAPNSCDLPCVEGCVCDPGMVLSGDKCVPFNQCGCVDKDGSYRPVCSTRCMMGSSSLTGSQGQRVIGHRSQVTVSCDLHLITYQSSLIKLISIRSYLKSVGVKRGTCKICRLGSDQSIVCEQAHIAKAVLKVTGFLIIILTIFEKSNVHICSGNPFCFLCVCSPVCSLYVCSRWGTAGSLCLTAPNAQHHTLTLPRSHYNTVCGMCGNFNNNGSDDSLMPDGLPAKDVVQLGNSWKAEGDSDEGCQPDDREDLDPKCTQEEESHYTALCMELLFDKRFQECHALLLQEPFLQNCVYDMCEYEGMLGTLCDNVGAYAQACQSLGITVSWRNSTFCPLPCPPNSQYSPCTAPCPPTCANLYADASCPRPPSACVEGCQCNPGFVLSGDQCVALSSCGCVDSKGEYHDVGDSWLNDHCERRCSCTPGGVLNCVAFQCSEKSVCALDSEGIRYCKPAKFDKCSISGDPHYRTFDRFVHHYQGPNTYILTQTHELPTSLAPFTVRGKNTRRGINRRVSFPKEVYIDIYGINIRFLQQRKVLVNGERVRPPFQPLQGLRLSQRSRFVQLHTDFGLSVSFDGKYHAEVVLPSTYQSHVRGLCGNYDGRSNNEYMKPDGSLTRNINEFGNSWQVSDRELPVLWQPNPYCRRALEENLETGFETGDCSVDQLTVVNGSSQCGALAEPQGPFAPCHPRLDPEQFQESCVFDLCAEQNDATLLCASYTVYAQACQELGVTLGPWRQKLNCALSCPPNSVYNSCISACPASCADLAAPSECDTSVCVEGCHCNPGFVLSGLDCVPYSQCGCTFQGHYYLLNEKFVSEDCSQSCQCTVTGAACEPKTCPVGHICTVYNDTRNCYKESPCLSMPCWNDGICQELPEGIGFNCQCLEGFEGPLC
uniref:Zonadhesin, like n=1 Tax=Lepisosteus oculatus TaxID=7918 RepID=W5N613_LEPOC